MSKYHCNSIEMTHWMFWKWWWEEFTDRNLCFATFFSTKKLGKNMSKNHCYSIEMTHWMSWKRLLKDVVQDETFQFQDELRSFILLSFSFHWFFFGLATVVPLWFPVMLPRCTYCREGPWGILRPETFEIFAYSANARAHVKRARARALA